MKRYLDALHRIRAAVDDDGSSDEEVKLQARVTEYEGKKTSLGYSLMAGDDCARGKLIAIRVLPEWREAK